MQDDAKREICTRLRSVEGHVRGVCRMVDEDVYCMDILKQITAIQSAMDKINALILSNHLSTCVTTAIRSDNPAERERVLGELVDVLHAGSRV